MLWERRPPHEPRDDLDVRRVAELVDRGDLIEPVAALDENARVAREGRGVARHRDDERHLRTGEPLRLRERALARRIEHDGVERLEFRLPQMPAKKIVARGRDRLCTPWSPFG